MQTAAGAAERQKRQMVKAMEKQAEDKVKRKKGLLKASDAGRSKGGRPSAPSRPSSSAASSSALIPPLPACTTPGASRAKGIQGNGAAMARVASYTGALLCSRCRAMARGKNNGGSKHTLQEGCAQAGTPRSNKGRWARQRSSTEG